MRRFVRTVLPARVRRYMAKKQREVDSGKPQDVVWRRARSTRAMQQVFDELKRMAGARERCMFCEDSRGVDIEHFWPKTTYPGRTFVWENLVLSCAGCNRSKGTRFDLREDGLPMLIDPTSDDPWRHLFYDSRTGIVTPRFVPETGKPDPRGYYTIERSNIPFNVQAVTEGRLRTQRNLIRCLRRFLESVGLKTDRTAAEEELLGCVDDNSDYGLTVWFFLENGHTDSPFSDLRRQAEDVWNRIVNRVTGDIVPVS